MKKYQYLLVLILLYLTFLSCDNITQEEMKIGNEKCDCHQGTKEFYSDLTTSRVRCNDGETFICD